MEKAESRPKRLAKFIPILDWLPGYPRSDFRFDLVAGLTASAVVIPQAMAYASIAGLPVEVGLYTALVPMVIYAVMGPSRPLSVSATSTIAMLTATTLAGVVQSSDPYVYYPASIHRRHNKNFGNAVLSKWEISTHEKIVFPKSGSDNKHTRNAVKAVIMISDQEVTAYSAHFETFWIMQARNNRQVTFLANQLNYRVEIVVVGGDFNSLTRGSVAYLEEHMGLKGLERLSKNTGHTFEYYGAKITLDHIFASGAEDFESGVWRGSDASDHYPIWSKISLQ